MEVVRPARGGAGGGDEPVTDDPLPHGGVCPAERSVIRASRVIEAARVSGDIEAEDVAVGRPRRPNSHGPEGSPRAAARMTGDHVGVGLTDLPGQALQRDPSVLIDVCRKLSLLCTAMGADKDAVDRQKQQGEDRRSDDKLDPGHAVLVAQEGHRISHAGNILTAVRGGRATPRRFQVSVDRASTKQSSSVDGSQFPETYCPGEAPLHTHVSKVTTSVVQLSWYGTADGRTNPSGPAPDAGGT